MPSDPVDDYYGLLGIAVDANDEDVRRAWRRLALEWHPDRAGVGTTAAFQRISIAYAVISDPVARRVYDKRRGIKWDFASLDSAMAKAPKGGSTRAGIRRTAGNSG